MISTVRFTDPLNITDRDDGLTEDDANPVYYTTSSTSSSSPSSTAGVEDSRYHHSSSRHFDDSTYGGYDADARSAEGLENGDTLRVTGLSAEEEEDEDERERTSGQQRCVCCQVRLNRREVEMDPLSRACLDEEQCYRHETPRQDTSMQESPRQDNSRYDSYTPDTSRYESPRHESSRHESFRYDSPRAHQYNQYHQQQHQQQHQHRYQRQSDFEAALFRCSRRRSRRSEVRYSDYAFTATANSATSDSSDLEQPRRVPVNCGHCYCSRCFHRYACAGEDVKGRLPCTYCGVYTPLAEEVTEKPLSRSTAD